MENFGSIIPMPLRGVAVRGPRYKLIKLDNGGQLFYDLQTDPLEHTNLVGNLTGPQLAAYAGFTNKLAGWHNPPAPPTISGPRFEAGAVKLSVEEQLGINYALLRATNSTNPNWEVVANYGHEVHTNEAVVTLSDPAPVPPAFYRVLAQGR